MTTVSNRNTAILCTSDNGLDIPEGKQQRIFEPLFTTKAIGKGTGLGLSISQQIVEAKHGGSLTCYSEVQKGTRFAIELPLISLQPEAY